MFLKKFWIAAVLMVESIPFLHEVQFSCPLRPHIVLLALVKRNCEGVEGISGSYDIINRNLRPGVELYTVSEKVHFLLITPIARRHLQSEILDHLD